MNQITKQILAYGNCEIVRFRGKAAYGKDMSPRTGTWYKADDMGKLAPHSEALGSVSEVNHGVVYRNNVFLPGEASWPCVVRFKSTVMNDAAAAAMPLLRHEESAEAGVVVTQSVNSRRRVPRPVKSAVRCGVRRAEPKKGKQPEVCYE